MTTEAASFLDQLARIIGQVRFDSAEERAIADSLVRLFTVLEMSYERDFALFDRVRAHLLLGRVAIVVTGDGAIADVVRKVKRIATSEAVDGVLVVTGRPLIARSLEGEANAKPVRVVIAAMTAG